MSMHYTVADVDAVVKLRGNRRIVTLSVKSATVSVLFAQYSSIEVGINDAYGLPFTLDLYKYETELRSYNGTLDEWFESIGDRALTITKQYPTLKLRTANYMPGFWKKGTYLFAGKNTHPSRELPIEQYQDLVIDINPEVNSRIHNYSLTTVNGYVVNSNLHDYGVRALYGGDIIRKSNRYSVGHINFENIGKVTRIPVTESMVHKVDESRSLYDNILINTKTNLSGKTVGIVLGGYLHLLDDFVRITGEQTIGLTMNKIDILNRLYESMPILDISYMALDNIMFGSVVNKVLSDEALLKYLTSPYTFIVLIDNPDMFTSTTTVNDVTSRYRYTTTNETLGVLRSNLGTVMDYWPKYECGTWSLNVNYDHIDNLECEHASWRTETRINDALDGVNNNRRIIPYMEYFHARIK